MSKSYKKGYHFFFYKSRIATSSEYERGIGRVPTSLSLRSAVLIQCRSTNNTFISNRQSPQTSRSRIHVVTGE